MPGTYIPIQMAFQLPSGLSIAAQVWGSPPLRDDETDPDPSSRSLRRINIIAGHGQLDNSNTWKKMIPYFMDTLLSAAGGARVSVVAIDYLGHGLSDHRLPDADYGRHKWAEDTIRVMDKLGWKKAALLAHSAGGEASTVAAVAFPDRITHLMLLDSDGPAPRAARAIPLETASFIRRRLRAPSKKTVFQTREEAIMRRARGNPIDGTIGIEASQILCERSLAEVVKDGRKVGYMWRTDQELMGNRPGNPVSRRPL